MGIVSSTYHAGSPQADGRHYVMEEHQLDDGQILRFEYLNDGLNAQFVMEERAALLNHELAERAAARQAVLGTKLPLTIYEFKKRMTADERKRVRARAKVDENVEDFYDLLDSSGAVYLTNDDVRNALAYLVALGDLSAERAAVIGAE